MSFLENTRVIRSIHHHRDIPKILGGGADHRRSADVDVLDELFQTHSLLGCDSLERIEIDSDQIDQLDSLLLGLLLVFRLVAPGEDAAVDLGVKRLHAPIEHFRKAGQLRHVPYAQPFFPEQLGRAAGRNDFNPQRGQTLRKFADPGFVTDADERPRDFSHDGSLEADFAN